MKNNIYFNNDEKEILELLKGQPVLQIIEILQQSLQKENDKNITDILSNLILKLESTLADVGA